MSRREKRFSEYCPDTNLIVISNIVLKKELVIDDLTCRAKVSFVGCSLYGRIHIRGGTFNDFSIRGVSMTNTLIVDGGTFNGNFVLDEIDARDVNNEFVGSVNLRGGEFKGTIDIYRGAFQSVRIAGAGLKGVTI